MNFLGIDFGLKHIGISLATTILAEPLTILDNDKSSAQKINLLCQQHQIGIVIIGVSEGKMAQKSREFGQRLQQTLGLPVKFHDETLSSHEAKQKLRHAKKSLRDQPQDAYQATVMLQDYLDTHTDNL